MVNDLQEKIRGDGTVPIISIEAENLAEATHKAIIACHDYGQRIETPKQKEGMALGYDANMLIRVKNPDADPKICSAGICEDARGIVQYILEVTHGIHNHWKKSAEHPQRWGYTYNERFVDQIPFVFERIEKDWKDKINSWGNGIGRISGRDYQFAIWRAGEDIVLEQEDPPCWQLGQIKFALDEEKKLTMNYQTHWRSRDLFKAWNENNIAQVELMKLFKKKLENTLQTEIKIGSYTDHCDSLHLYGAYVEKEGLEEKVERMKMEGYESNSWGLNDFLECTDGRTLNQLKGLVYAQTLAEIDGHGLNQSEKFLIEKGYSIENYPKEWDSWDPKWDLKPDKSKLARII